MRPTRTVRSVKIELFQLGAEFVFVQVPSLQVPSSQGAEVMEVTGTRLGHPHWPGTIIKLGRNMQAYDYVLFENKYNKPSFALITRRQLALADDAIPLLLLSTRVCCL